MYALLTEVDAVSRAGTIGVPPPRRIANERLNCESAKRCVSRPISGSLNFQRSVMKTAGRRCPPHPKRIQEDDQTRDDQEQIAFDEIGRSDNHPGGQRELAFKLDVELGKARNHVGHEDDDQAGGQHHEYRGVGEGAQDLSPNRFHQPLVLDVAPYDLFELAGALAGAQRVGVQPREDVAQREEGVRQRDPGGHLLMDLFQQGPEVRAGLLILEEIERLGERHPRVEQGLELGVEEKEILTTDPFRTREEGETKARSSP